MKQKTCQILYDYWNEIRGKRSAPHRFEIDPARIGTILPQTFVLERVNSNTFRFRLAGTKICEQFGREFKGANFLDFWNDADRLTLERQFLSTSNAATVGVSTFYASTDDGRRVLFEMILLPLFHVRPLVTRILGAIAACDEPSWLGHEPLFAQTMTSHETIWPQGPREKLPKDMFRLLVTDGSHSIRSTEAQGQAARGEYRGRLIRQDRRQFRVLEGGLGKPGEERDRRSD